MCNRVRESFEFREIRLRWDLINDLPQFNPIYNVSPGRKEADVLGIVLLEILRYMARFLYLKNLLPRVARGPLKNPHT